MALSFQELGGSPRESYSLSGFKAVREFLVPWESRTDFVRAVFGTSSLTATQTRVTYPGRKNVYASSLTFEPFEKDALCPAEMPELKDDLADYRGSFAKAVVEYEMLDRQQRKDLAIPEDGTAVTYQLKVAASDVLVSPEGWHWQDTGGNLNNDTVFYKRVPVTEHHITWSYVSYPPWTAIAQIQGKLNSSQFLGCGVGTLLFEGAEANKLYKPGYGLDEGAASFVWQIKYLFRELTVKINGGSYGWNAIARGTSGTWATILNTNNRTLYDSDNFNLLFRNVVPPADIPW